MIQALGGRLLRLTWNLPLTARLPPKRPVVLLYHGVPAAAHANPCARTFERHILFLKKHFDFVAPAAGARVAPATGKRQVLLTFDDGLRNNAEVVAPILRRYQVPAIFFVSSRHATPGAYLWFSYLEALARHFTGNGFSYGGSFFDMAPPARQQSVRRLRTSLLALRPHPAAMYRAIEEELPRLEDFVPSRQIDDCYAGMTGEQVAELADDPLFSIGVHTVDHPFLTMCERDEALRQIRENRTWIEAVSGRRCDAIAYPAGDYDADLLDLCRKEGFFRGYAVSSHFDGKSEFELPRIGIYSDSTDILGFKAQWGSVIRTVRMPIG
jgi:peptidoglycan/xylan/chitin deacetylase (PgdA/CDA1 family)